MPTPLEAIHQYYEAFSALDVTTIVPHFSEPSLTIAPQGMRSAATSAALAEVLAPLIHSLRARGYGRSEFIQPQVTMLGDADALVRGVAVRYTTAGTEMERMPFSYLLHRSDGVWKIAVLVAES